MWRPAGRANSPLAHLLLLVLVFACTGRSHATPDASSEDEFSDGNRLDPVLSRKVPVQHVEEYPRFVNLAAGRYAWQSSTESGGEAKLAVDGLVEQDVKDGLIATTKQEQFPWWQVDLEKREMISNITIFTRKDAAAGEMKAFYVIVSDNELSEDTFYDIVHRKDAFKVLIPEPLSYSITLQVEKEGRFVMIALLRKGSLWLSEVQVWGVQKCDLKCLRGKLDPAKCRCDCDNGFTGTHCQSCDMQCTNGGTLNTEVCLCACNWPWGGDTCEKCDQKCKYGKINEKKCTCDCPAPFTGQHCDKCPLQCANGGILNELDCTCSCPDNWTGPECKYCEKTCRHGGALDEETCKCKCPYPWSGNRCQKCSMTGQCTNGGILDEASCTCQCPFPYTGEMCETCALTCSNGGALDPKLCKCRCGSDFRPEPPGLGTQCQNKTCHLQCMHGGKADPSGCSCSCSHDWTGDTCEGCAKVCENGGYLDRGSCTCECMPPWTGPTCGSCPIKCDNDRAQVDHKTCQCICNDPWRGPGCEDCGLHCLNGGHLHRKSCACVCQKPWIGKDCGKCSLRDCGKYGTLDEEACQCRCQAPWTGGRCDKCGLECQNLGVLNPTDCTCSCKAPWKGNDCGRCAIKCENGGRLLRETCRCECFPPYGGLHCETRTWEDDRKAKFFEVNSRMIEVSVRGKKFKDKEPIRKGSYLSFSGAFSPTAWVNKLAHALGCSPGRLWITNITEKNPVDVDTATGVLGKGNLVYVVDIDIVDVTDAKRLPAVELEKKMRRLYNNNVLRNQLRIVGMTGRGWRNRTEKAFWIQVLRRLDKIEDVAKTRAAFKYQRIKRWLSLYRKRESQLSIAMHAFQPGFHAQHNAISPNSEKVPELFRLPWKLQPELQKPVAQVSQGGPGLSGSDQVSEDNAESGADVVDWADMSQDESDMHLVALLNAKRTKGLICKGQSFPPVQPLAWDQQLARAAGMHSYSMAEDDFIGHIDKMGRTYSDRIRLVNFTGHYPWGELVGKALKSEDAANTWIQDKCEEIMKPSYALVGVAHYKGAWTMDLASSEEPEELTPADGEGK